MNLFDQAKDLLTNLQRPEKSDAEILNSWILETRGIQKI